MANSREGSVKLEMKKIDLNMMDDQLQMYYNRVKISTKDVREEWEIDVQKLLVKEEIVGRGAFGTVLRGIYDGREVAVKVLEWGDGKGRTTKTSSGIKALKQEISLWQKLDHPNINKFIGAIMGTTSNQAYENQIGKPFNVSCIVTEYETKGSLKSYLISNRKKKLPFKTVIELALDLAQGLNYLHSKKIVHRDIKTENVLLDKNLKLKIADFGVARLEALNPCEMTGTTGTLGYMAPEVIKNEPYNRKCDVYSFGICLGEIYCCDMPYPNLSFTELTSAVVYQKTNNTEKLP
ncbi:serine/threonine-protein kinase HT1-like isoform X2 [Carica papaya]|uniref:serine/threonine-protein kinase HT1-like isoform X2 n=1 Tax=Carica papaya TaxID=3649 RepID=UPI000B8D0A68|nr:serine/threonine-protein kinase HT1-like isoform X2 [Carica papaya]